MAGEDALRMIGTLNGLDETLLHALEDARRPYSTPLSCCGTSGWQRYVISRKGSRLTDRLLEELEIGSLCLRIPQPKQIDRLKKY